MRRICKFYVHLLIPIIFVGLYAIGVSPEHADQRVRTDAHPSLDIGSNKNPNLIGSLVEQNRQLSSKVKGRDLLSHEYDPGKFHIPFISAFVRLVWRVINSHLPVVIRNILWGKFWKKFGWAGPEWRVDTIIAKNEGHEPQDGIFGVGGTGLAGLALESQEDWQSSYEQTNFNHPHKPYHHAMYPPVQKLSKKAAKKAQLEVKKAEKKALFYSKKSAKAAAKAFLYKQQIAPYSTGYLRPEQVYQGNTCVSCKYLSRFRK